jgi:hypothetical protein
MPNDILYPNVFVGVSVDAETMTFHFADRPSLTIHIPEHPVEMTDHELQVQATQQHKDPC